MLTTNFVATGQRRHPLALRFALAVVPGWYMYRMRRAKRLTIRILQSLDHRTLKDIGIDPSEIESAVHGRTGDRVRPYEPGWY